MQIKNQFKEHWRLGAGWKMTVAATTLAAAGGVALASPGIGGDDLPPIDLENPTVLDVGDDFQVVPGITVLFDDDSDASDDNITGTTFGDDSDDNITGTTLDDDDSADSDDDTTSTTLGDDDSADSDDDDTTSTTLDDDSADDDDSDDDNTSTTLDTDG